MPAETTPPSPKPRRPGGQPGNYNALKHGFYARHFKRSEVQDLESCQGDGLANEIGMLRLYIRRVVELSGDITDIDDALSVLRVISLAMFSISRLVKTQQVLTGGSDAKWAEFQAALSKAIADVNLEQDGEK